MQVRLTAADVGSRVVIRWRRPAERGEEIADVLGVLTAANDAAITANAAENPAALMIQPMTATHSDPTP